MIDIDYSDGKIKITTGDLSKIFNQEQIPLHFEIVKTVSQELIWSVDLNNDMWATFGTNEINDIIIKDAQGKFITQYFWNILNHGSILYKALWYYCKGLLNSGITPKGLVIGTHDGEFGEWVPVVRALLSDVLLVEGSKPQYDKLLENYLGKGTGIEFYYDIITPNGGVVEFFEGGRGYTNTIVERVIRSWETEEIHSTKRTSTGINELINNKLQGHIDWLHLDVEGLDAKLIMALEVLPPFIIFEDNNFLEHEKTEIYEWLKKKGYELTSNAGNCMATKKK